MNPALVLIHTSPVNYLDADLSTVSQFYYFDALSSMYDNENGSLTHYTQRWQPT